VLDGPGFTAADADPATMVVVATQGHGDEDAMEQAVLARPAYLGLVASHRRGAVVLGYLADRGLPKDQLDRVHVPAGLDLGRTSHRAIAVAILAELVQLHAAGAIDVAATGEAGAGAQADLAKRAAPAEAVDPVCGMTVTADESSYPLEHDGVTYYFCRAGCRRDFEANPAAYVKRGTRC
jgi:xanthine dehydrogenase accessory factor